MVRTPEQVSSDIVAHLRILDPEMSAQIGSPERKIIDAVSSVISASYIQSQITSSIWDIDTKSGVELEEVVGLFGFGRRRGSHANGILSIDLQQPAPTDYVIPSGTIASTIGTAVSPSVKYATTSPVVIAVGQTRADVPAQAIDEGAVGNTAAQTIVVLESWSNIASVYNPVPFVNGTDTENDEELRSRFKNTFLRNLAGTEDFYASLCLNHKNVTKVRVMGPVERHVEQLEAKADGSGSPYLQSNIEHSKFAWPQGTIITANSGQASERYFKEGLAYEVNNSVPKIRILCEKVNKVDDVDGNFIHVGDIVHLEHEYTPVASRNDPQNGVTNNVDIFVNGSEPTLVSESTIVNLKQLNHPSLVGKEFYDDFGDKMTTGRLQILGYGPLVALPSSIVVGNETYQLKTDSENRDYRLVRERSVNSGSTRALNGILFTGAKYPAQGSPLSLTYTYNRVPMVLDELLRFNKQITTDVLVHEADIVPLGVSLIVQLERGYSEDHVKAEVRANLTAWMNELPYGSWIQMSDIHNVVRRSPGVDNARIKKSTDTPTGLYGVRKFSRNARFVMETRDSDFRLADNQLPAFNSLDMVVKAENTFGG